MRLPPYYSASGEIIHKTQYAFLIADGIGRAAKLESIWRIPPADKPAELLAGVSAPFVGVALGSGAKESHKRLATARALELIRGIRETFPHATCLLLGSLPEKELNEMLADSPDFRGLNLTGRTSTVELMSVLKQCRVLFASCNGISHLAGVVGVPVVGFYGPTSPERTGPYGVPLHVVSKGMNCSPCYTPAMPYGCGYPVCMDIGIEPALEMATRYLARSNSGCAQPLEIAPSPERSV